MDTCHVTCCRAQLCSSCYGQRRASSTTSLEQLTDTAWAALHAQADRPFMQPQPSHRLRLRPTAGALASLASLSASGSAARRGAAPLRNPATAMASAPA